MSTRFTAISFISGAYCLRSINRLFCLLPVQILHSRMNIWLHSNTVLKLNIEKSLWGLIFWHVHTHTKNIRKKMTCHQPSSKSIVDSILENFLDEFLYGYSFVSVFSIRDILLLIQSTFIIEKCLRYWIFNGHCYIMTNSSQRINFSEINIFHECGSLIDGNPHIFTAKNKNHFWSMLADDDDDDDDDGSFEILSGNKRTHIP